MTRLALRPKDCVEMLGSKQLYTLCVRHGWLKPEVQRHRLTLYNSESVAACWRRVMSEGWPK